MVRIYVRNKGRYDPKTSESPLPFLDVDNPGDVLIKHVRETVKRRINCKLDELYYNNQLLDEDRSVAYSNLQDGTILESCSNPFWAACMYIRLRAVEQEAANNPTDQKKQRWTHQSIVNRAAALGVLFNSNSFERHQPPHLPTLQDLWTCLQTNGRKPVHMSEFTRTALQELQEEFQNIDLHRRDPLASFVHRHAVKLGFRDPNAPGPGDGPVNDAPGNAGPAEQGGNAVGVRGNNSNNRNGGRRRQTRPRPCDDCEAENATKYCAQAYKAPFAMLVALFKGLSQVPQIMSMTADEIKSRAQVFTDTDLSDRAAGKFFGGFDNMQNTLQINGFVQREAGENARFSLLQPGRALAQKCTEFHQAVEELLDMNRVPKVPQLGGSQCGTRRVCLLVDSKEPLCERMTALAHRQGVAAQIRDLPVGDFLWILLPPAAGVDYAAVRPDDEQVLPHIVERKTWDDLQHSLSTRRFRNQVEAMKNQLLNLEMADGFLVNRTGTWLKTAQWLLQLTAMAADMQNTGTSGGLITYAEYSTRASSKNLAAPEARPRADYLGVHRWSADKLVDIVFREFHNETNFSDAAKTELPDIPPTQRSRGRRPLLILHDLEVYNKNSQKFKDRALAEYLNQQAGNRTAREIVDTMLGASVRELIHFDVFCYWQLWLQTYRLEYMYSPQVHLGCHVKRTETPEETQRLENMYRQNRNNAAPNEALFMDNFHHNDDNNDDDDNDDDDGDYRGGAPLRGRGRGRRAQGRGRGNNRRGPQLPPNNRRVAGSTTVGRRKTPQGRQQDHSNVEMGSDPPLPDLTADIAGMVNDRMGGDEGRRLGSLSTDDFAPDSQNEDLMIQQALELSKAESHPATEKYGDADKTEDVNREEEDQLAEALRLSLLEHDRQTSTMQEHRIAPDKQQDFENTSNNISTESLDETDPIEIIDSQEVNETVAETEGWSCKDISQEEPIEIIDSQDTVESVVKEKDCPIEISDDSQNTGASDKDVQDTRAIELTSRSSDTREEELSSHVAAKEGPLHRKEINSEKAHCSIKQVINPSNGFNIEDTSTQESAINKESDVSDSRLSEKSSDLRKSNCEGGAKLEQTQQKSKDDVDTPVGMLKDTTTQSQNGQDAMPFDSNSDKMLNSSDDRSHTYNKEKEDSTTENVEMDPDLALAIRLSQEEAKMAQKRYAEAHVEKRVTRSKAKSNTSPAATHATDKPNISVVKREDETSLENDTGVKEELDPDLALALKLSKDEFIASQKQDEEFIRQKASQGQQSNNHTVTNTSIKDSEKVSNDGSQGGNASGQNNSHISSCAISTDQVLQDMQHNEPFSFVENSVQEEEFIEENFGQALQPSKQKSDSPEDNENKLKELAASLSTNTGTHNHNESLQDFQDFESQIDDTDQDICLALKLSEKENSSTASIAGNYGGRNLPTSQKDKDTKQDLERDFELAVRVAFQEKVHCDRSCSKLSEMDTSRVKEERMDEQCSHDKDFELAKKLQEDLNSKLSKMDTSQVKKEEMKEQCSNDKDLELARKLQEDMNREALQPENSKSTEAVKVLGGVKSSNAKRKLDLHYEKDLKLARQLEAELNGKPAEVVNSPKRIKVDVDYERDLALARQLEKEKNSSQTQYEKDLELARKLSEELNSNGSGTSSNSSAVGSPNLKRGLTPNSSSSETSEGPAVFRERRRERARSAQQGSSSSSASTSTSRPITSDRSDAPTCSGTPSTCDGAQAGTPRQNTTTCGACGQQGHNRSSRRCPRYFCEEEVRRRQAQAERRQARAEAEERDFRSKLGRLEREREESARVRSQLRRQFEEMDRRMREREEDAQAVIQHLDKGRKKRKK
uniref:Crossover junction endonuclease MUS81 n=1 Tax=Branchiostoma floridae TaxID=7739 RepID=C3XPU5_BRAFL|eukprot:XP_002613957.1 hypothetical protein BRAFLDRAFT_67480 [Branchiostoma floridae]